MVPLRLVSIDRIFDDINKVNKNNIKQTQILLHILPYLYKK